MLATSPSKKARLEALSFIVHFMGDLPLHTSEDKEFSNHLAGKGDRGGNYRKNIKVGDEQLIRAGIRLAAVLRRIFPDS